MSQSQWKQFVQLYSEKHSHLTRQQVLQQAKKPFQQLKQYYQYQSGGALSDDQKIILRERLDHWIAERQSERELDEDAPPPLPQLTPSYNKIQLLENLQNINEGVFVQGDIGGSNAMTSRNQVYGIKINNRYYVIFIKDGDFNNVIILEIF